MSEVGHFNLDLDVNVALKYMTDGRNYLKIYICQKQDNQKAGKLADPTLRLMLDNFTWC